MKHRLAGLLALAALMAATQTHAGFKSPESLARNIYAYYGGGGDGLPRDEDTARNFLDPSLHPLWLRSKAQPYDFFVQSSAWKLGPVDIRILRKQFDRTYVAVSFANNGKPVTMNVIAVNSPEGWVIYDVESTHDSLRLFLQQLKN